MHARMHACVCVHACVYACRQACVHVHVLACWNACMRACSSVCVLACECVRYGTAEGEKTCHNDDEVEDVPGLVPVPGPGLVPVPGPGLVPVPGPSLVPVPGATLNLRFCSARMLLYCVDPIPAVADLHIPASDQATTAATRARQYLQGWRPLATTLRRHSTVKVGRAKAHKDTHAPIFDKTKTLLCRHTLCTHAQTNKRKKKRTRMHARM